MTNHEERRSDFKVREQVKNLLVVIRDFHATCHMVSVGQLEPSKAKAKAKSVEAKLNEMMKELLTRVAEIDAQADEDASDGA